MMKRLMLAATFALLPFSAHEAQAAACAGFVDLDDSNPFCSSVVWIKNRGVTQGCTLTHYCPNDNVPRLQMAAFLQRLGTAVVPQYSFQETELTTVDLGTGADVCHITPITIAGYRRNAVIDGTISMIASTSPASFLVDAIYSINGGLNWQFANQTPIAVYASSQVGNGAIVSAPIALNPGNTFVAAIRIRREGVSVANIDKGACNLRVTLTSSTLP